MRQLDLYSEPSNERIALIGAQVALLIFFLAVYWQGENSFVLIHDNLDSNIVWLKLLKPLGWDYFSYKATIPSLLNGVPVSTLSCSLNIGVALHLMLDTFTAILVNEAVIRFVAFWGMLLLLQQHILKTHRLAAIGVALCFSLLPFYPAGFLSVAGQPLILYIFLNLRQRQGRWFEWLCIIFYPFYSDLILSGFALVLLLLTIFFVDILNNRRANLRYLWGGTVLCCLYLLSNYRLIFSMFVDTGFVSHRVEFKSVVYTLKEALELVRTNFLSGQYHAASLQGTFILVSVVVAFVLLILMRNSTPSPLFWRLLFSCLAISIFYGMWKYFKPDFPDYLLLRGFQWERLHFLHPLLWHLLFAVSLGVILNKSKNFPIVAASLVLVLVCSQATYAVYNSNGLREKEKNGLTYGEFFSEPLFAEIAKAIDQPKESYRVASLGLHPSIAQFNGFYTLDAYVANYPLEYKQSFRRIIGAELDKSPRLKRSFDDWGSRCYLFSSEIGYSFLNKKNSQLAVRNLQIDTDQFWRMGGRYIFSAVPILNGRQNNLQLLRSFEREDSPWRIWLYEVIQPGGEAV